MNHVTVIGAGLAGSECAQVCPFDAIEKEEN